MRRRPVSKLVLTLALLTGASLATGCVGGSKGGGSNEQERLKAYILDDHATYSPRAMVLVGMLQAARGMQPPLK